MGSKVHQCVLKSNSQGQRIVALGEPSSITACIGRYYVSLVEKRDRGTTGRKKRNVYSILYLVKLRLEKNKTTT